jgi:DNA-binding MurR/RpiR family transcriptional regulator
VADGLLQARLAGAKWLLAFAMPRYPRATVEALSTARALGYRMALVTDSRLVPFAHRADIVLAAAPGSRLVFDSHSAGLVLAALLLESLADAAPERTQARLEEYEEVAERHGFFSS